MLVQHQTTVEDLSDPQAVRERYYREMEELVQKATGATRVVAFDHNVRSAPRA
jgi:DhnA family fructose-bisphosphate aldolase class Ia